jgi:hypothetical protein
MLKRIAALVVGSFVMMACGPGAKINGKQGAAEALYAASGPTSGKSGSASPVDLTGFNYKCPQGGEASFSGAGFSVGSGGVSADLTLKYDNCGAARSDVGVAIYNGSMTYTSNITATSNTARIGQKFKGKLTVTGAFDDFIEADVTQEIAAGDLGSAGTGVTMKLVGTITTSTESFTFNDELSITGGTISAKVMNSQN